MSGRRPDSPIRKVKIAENEDIMELSMNLVPEDGRHLYQQIYEYIREEIRTGRLLPGERLPATRQLAGTLHIARTTVELAYEQLEEEGYLVIRRGSGAYVCEITNMTDLSDTPETENRNQLPVRQGDCSKCGEGLSSAAAEEFSSNSEGVAKMPEEKGAALTGLDSGNEIATEKGLGGRIDFSPRTIDMSAFPYATWRRILRGILTGDRADLFRRGDPQGDLELRTTISRYLHLSRGCHCEPEQIVIGAGNDYLLMLLAMILGENRHIAMDDVTYLRAAKVMSGMGYSICGVGGDEQGLSVAALRDAECRLAYVMPARQFPSGIVMPYPRRAELLAWATAEDGYIIEDDYDSEFKYRGRPVPSLQSADLNGRVIYMGTFSKAIAPAIRISYLILPKRLLKVFHERAGFLSCTVPRLDQAVLNEFIRDGYFERYLNRMRNRYKAKHDRLLTLLEPLETDFQITGQGAGLHLVLHPQDGYLRNFIKTSGIESEKKSEKKTGKETGNASERTPGGECENTLGNATKKDSQKDSHKCREEDVSEIERKLARLARQQGVLVYPMSEQRLRNKVQADIDLPANAGEEKDRPAILLGYAALSEEELKEGVLRLEKAWKMP